MWTNIRVHQCSVWYEVLMDTAAWTQWQNEVVALLQRDFEEALHHIRIDDIDWPSWHDYYAQGKSPRAALDRALERDL
jgi:hypothetical protein